MRSPRPLTRASWHPDAVPALPPTAAWRYREARDGFEVVFLRDGEDGAVVEGHTAAVEDGVAWAVTNRIWLDDRWVTRRAEVSGHTAGADRATVRVNDGDGTWLVDGREAHQRYDYTSPAFDFRCVLEYDQAGLVLEYPGIAQRVR